MPNVNRLTLFADIAGRVAIDTRGNPRVTAASVALGTSDAPAIRGKLSSSMPKWRDCVPGDAERVVEFIASHAVSVGVMSINKDTAAWRQFAKDAKTLQSAIVGQSRRSAGWAKPPNLLAFHLLGGACAIATGHGITVGAKGRIVDARGLQMIECSVV